MAVVLSPGRIGFGFCLGGADSEQQVPRVAGRGAEQGRHQRDHPGVGEEACVPEKRASGQGDHAEVAEAWGQVEQ